MLPHDPWDNSYSIDDHRKSSEELKPELEKKTSASNISNFQSDNFEDMSQEDVDDLEWCFEEGSETCQLVKQVDWGKTSIGPMKNWPMSFKTALSIIMSSRFPMVVWFGPDLLTIYNDAYMPQMGVKHPSATGRPAHLVWPEIWDIVGMYICE